MSDSCSRALAGAWLKAHLPNVAFQPWSAHVFFKNGLCYDGCFCASEHPAIKQIHKNSCNYNKFCVLWTITPIICDQNAICSFRMDTSLRSTPFCQKTSKKHLFKNNEKTHAEEARARMHDSNFVCISLYIRIMHSKCPIASDIAKA